MRMRARQSGFALIAAMFLLVVLAGLIAYMMSLAAAQRQTTNLALISARTMSAARAGLDWGVYRVAGPPEAHSAAMGWGGMSCDSDTDLNIDGVSVVVECDAAAVEDGAMTRQRVTISATAVSGDPNSPDYVRKVLRTTLLVP